MFTRMMAWLAGDDAEPMTVMIDATHLKAHRTASSLRAQKGISAAIIAFKLKRRTASVRQEARDAACQTCLFAPKTASELPMVYRFRFFGSMFEGLSH